MIQSNMMQLILQKILLCVLTPTFWNDGGKKFMFPLASRKHPDNKLEQPFESE